MVDSYREIPVTKDSHPLIGAAKKCDFAKRGYVEEELFAYGRANVYKRGEKGVELRAENAPYINRILVRRPADPRTASGRVVVEILNATSAVDIDRVWLQTKNLLMREGDAYIGITSKPSSIEVLKKFNPHRYEELSWKNPVDEYLPQFLIQQTINGGVIDQSTETGLIWDMLTDCALDCKSGKLPLGGISVKKVYLSGWSQSVGYVIRYVNDLAYKDGDTPYDGYLAFGGVRMHVPGLNQYEIFSAASETDTYIKKVTVPFIAVQTESENGSLGNEKVREPDSDEPDRLYRTYDIPGSTHDNYYNMSQYFVGDTDVHDSGRMTVYTGEEPIPNNYPYEFAFCAITKQMYDWAEKGIAAVRCKRIPVSAAGYNVRDRLGNAKGGWRLPPIDVPVAVYVPHVHFIIPNPLGFQLYGCVKPFSEAQLKELYGDLANYERLVREAARRSVQEARLLPEDEEECIAFCLAEAEKYGLKG